MSEYHTEHHAGQHDGGYGEHQHDTDEHQTPGADMQEHAGGEQEHDEAEESRPTPSNRSRTKVFSWADVEDATNFVLLFNSAPEQARQDALALFNMYEDSDGVDLAQALYPSGGVIRAYDIFSDIARKVAEDKLGFMDGMTLATTISEAEDATVRALVRMVNYISPSDEEVVYRRNMATPVVVENIMNALQGVSRERIQVLDFLDEALALWPGNR